MAASTRVDIPRSDVVGSLLRPAYLREARKAAREGKLGAAELRTVEDRAVREAIGLQELASGEAGNPLTPEQQEAKLRRVGEVARNIWKR